MDKEKMMLEKIAKIQSRNLQLYSENKNLKKRVVELEEQVENALDLVRKYKRMANGYVQRIEGS